MNGTHIIELFNLIKPIIKVRQTLKKTFFDQEEKFKILRKKSL